MREAVPGATTDAPVTSHRHRRAEAATTNGAFIAREPRGSADAGLATYSPPIAESDERSSAMWSSPLTEKATSA
jgi:hypothetical protein